jgi:methyltransferase, FkbM family
LQSNVSTLREITGLDTEMIGKRTLAKKKSSKIKNTIFILGGLFCVVASLILSSSSWNTRTTARIRQQELVPSSSSPPSSALNMLLQSALKTRSGDGWKIVDFSGDVDNHDDDENPHGFQCEWTLFRSTSGNEANMCVHPFHDIVSNKVRQSHRWHDCDVLPKYWHENSANNSQIYVEIGGNIGTCVMEMLLSTDAPIIAFEPNPRNVFVLKETLRKMEKSYQERIVIVPVALGDEKGSNKIYAASNNMGNSVVGKVIKDFQTQEFSENNQFDIRIEKLEDILKPGTDIGLVKMDAQGCKYYLLSLLLASVMILSFDVGISYLCTTNELVAFVISFGCGRHNNQ